MPLTPGTTQIFGPSPPAPSRCEQTCSRLKRDQAAAVPVPSCRSAVSRPCSDFESDQGHGPLPFAAGAGKFPDTPAQHARGAFCPHPKRTLCGRRQRQAFGRPAGTGGHPAPARCWRFPPALMPARPKRKSPALRLGIFTAAPAGVTPASPLPGYWRATPRTCEPRR